mmetsp:Transcript_3286/g.14905  ORF Transcript_3286/g.14905 Transcript_3286/m.14905 type:complete len:536 (+) Transcript_3286:1016-2623(+)
MAPLSAWFGTSVVEFRRRLVTGLVNRPCENHCSMARFSYVCPSSAMTGSVMTPCVIGHKNAFSTFLPCDSADAMSLSAAATAADASSSSACSRWFAASNALWSMLGGAPAAVRRSRTARTSSSEVTAAFNVSSSSFTSRADAPACSSPAGAPGVDAGSSPASRSVCRVDSDPPGPESALAPAPASSSSSETSRNVNTSDESASRLSPRGPTSRWTRVSAAPFAGLALAMTRAYTYRSSFTAPPDVRRDSAAAAAASPGVKYAPPPSRTATVSPDTSGRRGRAVRSLASRGRTSDPGSPLALSLLTCPCAGSIATRDDPPPGARAAAVACIVASSFEADSAMTAGVTAAASWSFKPSAETTARAINGAAGTFESLGGETYTRLERVSWNACVPTGEPYVTSAISPDSTDSAARPVLSEWTTRKLPETSRRISRSSSTVGTDDIDARITTWRASAKASRASAAAKARASGQSVLPTLDLSRLGGFTTGTTPSEDEPSPSVGVSRGSSGGSSMSSSSSSCSVTCRSNTASLTARIPAL